MRQNYDLAILGMYLRGCDCVCEKPVQQKQHAKRDVTPAPPTAVKKIKKRKHVEILSSR